MNRFTIAAIAAVLMLPGSAHAQPAVPAAKDAPAASPLSPPIEQWELPNGLQVALARTDRAPAVAVQVWYHTGSKDEPRDKRGTAHMFEHLMFKGSARVAPDAHTRYIKLAGGYSNAITTEDGTAFHNTVPKNRLGFVLELEADRMRSLVFQPKTVTAERKIVAQEIERNLRNPLYAAVVRLLPAAFGKHPYAWTSGGVAAELETITAEQLAAFYAKFYAPNNALIVVVGDLDRATIAPLIEKHFGSLERGPDLPRPNLPPPLKGARKTAPSIGKLGFALAGYRIPAAKDADIYPLQLLSLALSRGESSRLFRKLVESKIAVEAGGQAIVREQVGAFMVFAAYTNPANAEQAESVLLAEMAQVRTSGLTAAELSTAKEQARAALGFAVASVDGLAQQIGTSWVMNGDPAHFADDLKKFAAVSQDDIKRVAGKYFTDENRVIVALPVAGPASGPGANK